MIYTLGFDTGAGGESSWYDTVWRLVRGGIGGENSQLQLVHGVLTVYFCAILRNLYQKQPIF